MENNSFIPKIFFLFMKIILKSVALIKIANVLWSIISTTRNKQIIMDLEKNLAPRVFITVWFTAAKKLEIS